MAEFGGQELNQHIATGRLGSSPSVAFAHLEYLLPLYVNGNLHVLFLAHSTVRTLHAQSLSFLPNPQPLQPMAPNT